MKYFNLVLSLFLFVICVLLRVENILGSECQYPPNASMIKLHSGIYSSTENLLLMDNAEKLHESFGKEVRVAGHCGCPSPKEWYNHKWNLGVNFYHVDSQEGLNALVKAITLQTNE